MSFMRKKCKTVFHKAELSESKEVLTNPGRGWYRIYPFSLEREPDFEELFWCLVKEERLALLLIDIGAYREGSLPQEALLRLAEIFAFFQKQKKEMIIRPVYDREGKGMEREPDFIQTVEEHMRQLGPVLSSFSKAVYLVQGLLIGSWGEMHDSKFLAESRLIRLFDVWREALCREIPIAVRTPRQWRILHQEGAASDTCTTGLFDDGMFGSPDNLGTYGSLSRKEAGWKERWCREEELAFIRTLSAKVPYGGEAVGSSAVTGELCRAVEEMRRTGVSYLNRTHDIECLNRWEQSIWREKGVFNGCNGLDYIGCHMGYRFVVREVSGKGMTNKVSLRIKIENVGFSVMREEAELVLEREDGGGVTDLTRRSVFPKELLPGGLREFAMKAAGPAPGERFELFLRMERKRDREPIAFANRLKEKRVYLGVICAG